jgi:hypothetical protein
MRPPSALARACSHAALAAQGACVAALAGFGPRGALAGAALGAVLGAVALGPALRRAPAGTAMLALGGLGMTLGWWADLGFASAAQLAAHARAPADPAWCRAPAGLALLAGLPGLGHAVSWMNAGMLALGLPAAAAARRAGHAHAHGGLATLGCAAAMVAGMTAGSHGAARLAAALSPGAAVVLDYAAMTIGMAAGMALFEAAAQRVRRAGRARITAWRRPPAPARTLSTRKPARARLFSKAGFASSVHSAKTPPSRSAARVRSSAARP